MSGNIVQTTVSHLNHLCAACSLLSNRVCQIMMSDLQKQLSKALYMVVCRRDELLEDSKDWITPETLDARIQYAIENPVELYEHVAQQDWNYKSA